MSSSEASSTSGNSQLLGDLSLESRTRVVSTATIDSKYRLDPISPSKLNDKKELITYYITPMLAKSYQALGMKLPLDMESMVLTRIFNNAVPSTIKETVRVVVREKSTDYLGLSGKKNSKAEFLVWYVNVEGNDKRGEPCGSAYVVKGMDKACNIKQRYDEFDEPLPPEITGTYDIYTCLYTPEKLDEILANTDENDLDSIQFSVTTNKGSWTKYNKDEIRDLPLSELEERGTLGRMGSDLTIQFSSLSTAQKVQLQLQSKRS